LPLEFGIVVNQNDIPMTDRHSITLWIERLKAGDADAARELWDRYFTRLVTLARNRLENAPRRVADEEDIALSVFDSLCAGAVDDHFPDVVDRDDLWPLLLRMTQRKCVDHIRRSTRRKRGGGAVRGESVFEGRVEDFRASLDGQPGAQPTPEFLAEMAELQSELLRKLRNDDLRNAAVWKMEGHTNEEVANRLGISVRAVERKLQIIREKWSRELENE
jgi:DNA-directed RNA polymerase specialized sigma24 family protein